MQSKIGVRHQQSTPNPGALLASPDFSPSPRSWSFEDDFTIKGKGYVIRHVSGDQKLEPAFKAWFKSCLIRAFPDLRMEEYFAIKSDWFEQFDHLVFGCDDATGEAVSVLASKWHQGAERLCFLHATTQLIATNWQRSNMLRHMWAMHFYKLQRSHRGFPPILVLKTCNPSAFRPMHMFANTKDIHIYPRVDGSAQDSGLVSIARRIAKHICSDYPFCAETGVIKGISVPADFYPSVPRGVRAGVLESYFSQNLDVSDRILCVAVIASKEAQRRLCRAFGVPSLRQERKR